METTPKVEPEVAISGVSEDIVRKMPHEKWLREFAQVLGMTRPNSPPMTPFRQGAIAKLQLAARYIALLEKDLHWARKGVSTEKGEDSGNSDA